MSGVATIEQLLARLARVEEETQVAKREAGEAKARALRAEEVSAQAVAARSRRRNGGAHEKQTSRRDLLKLAGTAAVGAAGAAAFGAYPAAAADGQSVLLGTTGDAQNHETSTTTIRADPLFSTVAPSTAIAFIVDASAANTDVEAFRAKASGNFSGITAFGGGASVSPGVGVVAVAGGLAGPSGLAAGQGLNATGSGGSPGVYATGGGSASGIGVVGLGGAPDGRGIVGIAAGAGSAVWGNGGAGRGGLFSGGLAQLSLSPASSVSGPPTSGTHLLGDIWMDILGTVWICTAGGTPGTFAPLQQGGLGNALFSAVSTQQYTLPNSDGVTWVDLDATTLKLTIKPTFKCSAVLTGNCDLWTANATYNQDLGIAISGGAYPTTLGQPEAWKESGGFAGTFSPNAAFVQTVKPLVAGTTYTVKLQWKANKPASGATIYAGAGPIPAGSSTFSPTLLTALLIVTA